MKLPTTIEYDILQRAGARDAESYMTGLEHELRAEQAASLGRIGRKLERAIADLEVARAELSRCQTRGPERLALVEKCLALHSESERYFWYMQVQRECMGINNHDALREHYPIPSALP